VEIAGMKMFITLAFVFFAHAPLPGFLTLFGGG
jgi:hypothetical protein